ncbi:hypothetical protein BGX24_004068 [Mortierella sp. AD032]|nr:hypothetical protein BGX24_004068 [Mortierella sp. AD032]
MTFSKTTTMAAAALLAVLFLGSSSTYAAPVDPAVKEVGEALGGAFGSNAAKIVKVVSPEAVDAAIKSAMEAMTAGN